MSGKVIKTKEEKDASKGKQLITNLNGVMFLWAGAGDLLPWVFCVAVTMLVLYWSYLDLNKAIWSYYMDAACLQEQQCQHLGRERVSLPCCNDPLSLEVDRTTKMDHDNLYIGRLLLCYTSQTPYEWMVPRGLMMSPSPLSRAAWHHAISCSSLG